MQRIKGKSQWLNDYHADCDIVASELEFQLCCCVHFLTNILMKGMNPFISLNYKLNSTAIVLQEFI